MAAEMTDQRAAALLAPSLASLQRPVGISWQPFAVVLDVYGPQVLTRIIGRPLDQAKTRGNGSCLLKMSPKGGRPPSPSQWRRRRREVTISFLPHTDRDLQPEQEFAPAASSLPADHQQRAAPASLLIASRLLPVAPTFFRTVSNGFQDPPAALCCLRATGCGCCADPW